ncbi:Protein of unknown function [Pyronema omphalodes CBS 100304]|uniref:Secreted protein n=1 Tax=Pyronema omphalodes (strain CBS 100304) TaxID=1076935 RepID=U4L7V7_PYROM|nr:Protein of unknown function [Pyronema omphalodes CBS 100304]
MPCSRCIVFRVVVLVAAAGGSTGVPLRWQHVLHLYRRPRALGTLGRDEKRGTQESGMLRNSNLMADQHKSTMHSHVG